MPAALHYGSKGPRVKNLQWRINNNAFYHPRKELVVDGQMLNLTCAAVQQAKYRCGYSRANLLPIAGQPLYDYLSKRRPLPPALRKRRAARLAQLELVKHAQSAQTKMRLKALAAAKADDGVHERQVNIIKFNGWWNDQADHEPYCVRAGSYWYKKGGSTVIDPHASRFEGTDYLLGCAKSGQYGLHLTSDPDPGVSFVIDFSGRSDPDHFGLFVKDLGAGWFLSLEANATLSDGTQGVGYHKRMYRNCWFIVFTR